MGLVEENDFKINIRDMAKVKLSGQKASSKLAEVDAQLESIIPKLVCVMMETFCDYNFITALNIFNSNSNCKVTYSILDLYTTFVSFVDRVCRHKSNGYKGYSVSLRQIN